MMENSSGQITPNLGPSSLCSSRLIQCCPPKGLTSQLVLGNGEIWVYNTERKKPVVCISPRTKKWRDLVQNTERKKSVVCISPERVQDEVLRQLPTVVGWSIHQKLLGWIGVVGKTRLLWFQKSLKTLVKGRVLNLWLKKSLETEILNSEEHRSCPSK